MTETATPPVESGVEFDASQVNVATDTTIDQKFDAERVFYLNYWKDRFDTWKEDDPERAHLARLNHIRLANLTVHTVKRGELAPGTDPRETELSQLREWVHILGPENQLHGAAADLELVAGRIIEHIDDCKDKIGDRESALMDAASCLVAAARVQTDSDKAADLRSSARTIMKEVRGQIAPDADVEINKHGGDAAMLLQEIDYDELYESYFVASDQMTPAEFQRQFAMLHMRHVKEFLAVMGGRETDHNLPAGVAFEWWHTLMHRHFRLTKESPESLVHERLRTSLSFEDAPHTAKNAPMDRLSDAKDATVEQYDDDGNPKTIGLIQIKSHGDDTTRYRKPIVVIAVKDKDLQSNRQLLAHIRVTSRGMISMFKGERDKVPMEDMKRAAELVDWHRYPESTLV